MRKFVLSVLFCFVSLPAFAATLYVSQFTGAPPVSVYYQAARAPAITTTTVAIAGASAQSAVFGTSTGLIRVVADVACHVVIGGTNPTATTSSAYLPAGAIEYYVVSPGDRLAVIAAP